VVHGGAGAITQLIKREYHSRRLIIKKASAAGFETLERGRSSVDAVESAIKVLEDSGIFNAGSGSALTIDGKLETDAAIMMGDLSCGAVGEAGIVKNPISLARAVMEKTDHVLIVGRENLTHLAKAIDFPMAELVPLERRKRQLEQYLSDLKHSKIVEWPRNSKLLPNYEIAAHDSDTVGAVAIDKKGQVASGVSTGGRFLKLPGRIGDSAIVGAGLYADGGAGAASATGIGEDIIRVALSKNVCDLMRIGADAQTACDTAISLLTRKRGADKAGVIAVDSNGSIGFSRNTQVMAYSYKISVMKRAKVVILPKDER
jgi:L-asparaginase / beta-aspartyl-peptidase